MLVKQRTNLSNYLHACQHQGKPNQDTIDRTKELINIINENIKAIEKDVTQKAKEDKKLNNKLQYLLSIPGVGLITAITIIAETNGFATITNIKQLTSYTGLNVQIRESGKWKGKSRISKKGNSHIRKALFMPALSKMQWDKSTALFYQRLKDKKGKGMIATVAVQRKLLGLMYTLWKKEEMFNTSA